MPKIHNLRISHFRGICRFEQTFRSDLVCLIGRGDSGKSTILEAISYILSPSWNIPFFDNDFYNCNTEKSIEIEATLKDLPADLLREDKYGLFLRGLNTRTNDIVDDSEESHEPVLSLRLEVKKDLEPKWSVFTAREVGSKPISAGDRAKLNTFLVSDYLDRHFSWSKGSPLYSLFVQGIKIDDDDSSMIDALREAKQKIDKSSFSKFDLVVNKIKASAASYGIDISKTLNTIDFKDIVIKDGKLCLHDEVVPFRLKGKGSKRLISMAIQSSITDVGGIVLIDEVEQGLEPDRVQSLVDTIKQHRGQVFITTHSRDVLVELSVSDLFLMRRGANKLTTFDPAMQGLIRKNPESFFAKKVLVAEGATEIGICRALNAYRVQHGLKNAAYLGVRTADGSGSEGFDYCKGFANSGFSVALFCDSDEDNKTDQKNELLQLGVQVFDWEKNDSLELAVMKYLPFSAVMKAFELAAILTVEEDPTSNLVEIKKNMWEAVKSRCGVNCPSEPSNATDLMEIRKAIGVVASKKKMV